MGNYKHGKQTQLISFQTFQELMSKQILEDEEAGFLWLLYYCGVRKSEAYERTAEDCKLIMPSGQILSFPFHLDLANLSNLEIYFQIDFKTRKKHGSTVPPLELPLSWPGIQILVKLAQRAAQRSGFHKNIFVYPNKEREIKSVLGHWIFPNIQSTRAWALCKRVLGPNFYPHFFRLNRLTEIASDPGSSLTRLKSFSGIKSLDALESYLGSSQKEQRAAMRFMDKQMSNGNKEN